MRMATTAIAEAKLWLVPTSPTYSLYMITGKVVYPSPIISGVPKSAIALMKTMSVAARIEGMHKGITTLKNLLAPLTPMLADASRSDLSTFFMAPETYMNTSGNSFNDRTRRMPLNP